jgi:hypothetical protein
LGNSAIFVYTVQLGALRCRCLLHSPDAGALDTRLRLHVQIRSISYKEINRNEMLRSSRVHPALFCLRRDSSASRERLRESCEERGLKMEWLLCVHACLLPGKQGKGTGGVAWPHRVIAGVGHSKMRTGVSSGPGNQWTRVGMGMRQTELRSGLPGCMP